MKRSSRLLAVGGVVGPGAFVWSWIRGGSITPGYSPTRDHISELAAIDAPTRVAMTTGFVVYGIGTTAFGLALREAIDGPAWIAALVTGISSLGVAAAPLRARPTDRAHATFAAIGYAGIATLPLLAAPPLSVSGRPDRARVARLTGAAAATALVASTFGPARLLATGRAYSRGCVDHGDRVDTHRGSELNTHDARPDGLRARRAPGPRRSRALRDAS